MKRIVVGRVTSNLMQKTIRVAIPRRVKDAVTGKYVSRETACLVHDECGEAKISDLVEIVESRPISRRKRWVLVKVVSNPVGL